MAGGAFDALFGNLYDDGTPKELRGGQNFVGFTFAPYNDATGKPLGWMITPKSSLDVAGTTIPIKFGDETYATLTAFVGGLAILGEPDAGGFLFKPGTPTVDDTDGKGIAIIAGDGGPGDSDGGTLQLRAGTFSGIGDKGEVQLQAHGGTPVVRVTKVGTVLALSFYNATPVVKPTVTGSRGGNAALASLLTALANLGLVTDSSS